MKYIIAILIALSGTLHFKISAQQYNFHSIGTETGLPSSECDYILKDSKGYLWISTDAGLAKYNGRTFKTFTVQNGLTDNTIFETYEDESGKLFYSTGNSKLGYIKNDTAFTLPITDTLASILGNGQRLIYSVCDYNKDDYLIATQIGFFTIDKKTMSKLEYLSSPKNANYLVKVFNGKIIGAMYAYNPIESSGKFDFFSICIERIPGRKFLFLKLIETPQIF